MKSWVALFLAIALAACSSTGNKQQASNPEPSGQRDLLATQLAESAFQESSGTLKLVFDAKGNWVLLAVKNRVKLATGMPCLHGSKRETAALTATPQHIAPTPRKGCATPGCIRPQPALDPATGRRFGAARKHFSGLEKALRQNYALFDRHSHWVKITSKGTADLADDSPRARETALMIAGMRAKRTVAEFLNNDVKSTKTLTRIARSYARNFQSSESRSADDADTDDSEAMSRPSDDQTSRSEKTRQAHRFASNLAERIHGNSSAIIKGAFVSYRSFEDGRVIVEITASRESIGAARQLSRLMSGVMP